MSNAIRLTAEFDTATITIEKVRPGFWKCRNESAAEGGGSINTVRRSFTAAKEWFDSYSRIEALAGFE